MKKSFVWSGAILVALLSGSIQSMAQAPQGGAKTHREPLKKIEGNFVSAETKAIFSRDFTEAKNVQWLRKDVFDEALFNLNGNDMHAWYDFDHQLVGTTTIVPFSKVPEKGQKEIAAKYKDYKTGQVIYFDDNEANETDMILYDQQFDDADNYFVELSKGNEHIVLMVNPQGWVSFFKKL